MLSYQHGYHAGCFADVVKHVILTQLTQYMTQKEKPLFYLETHSGRGLYDLQDAFATKTGEFKEGIELLWQQRQSLAPVFAPFIEACQSVNQGDQLRFYPGSPAIAIHQLRAQDRLFFCELHPQEFDALERLPKQRKRVFYSHEDGVKSLSALLPPTENRGLIFIDPSFEMKAEYRDIPSAIQTVYKHFQSGVYCLWYPIIDNKLHAQLVRGMAAIQAPSLQMEFYLNQKNKATMQACGLWVINPPYVLAQNARVILETLKKIFNPGHATYLIND